METVKEEVLKVEQEELASLRELNQQFQGFVPREGRGASRWPVGRQLRVES